MSSILAALKKVAHETPSSPSRPAPAGSLDIQEAVNARVNRRIRRRRMVSAAIGVVVVAGVGSAAYKIPWKALTPLVSWPFTETGRTREHPSWPPPGIASKSKMVSVLPPSNPKPASAQDSRVIVAVPPAADHKTDKYLPSADTEPLWLKKNLQNARHRPKLDPTPGSMVPKSKRAGHIPPQITGPPATTHLRLQALAWSEDMVRRMAVINDQVVREGDRVAGFRVVSIHQEKVVLDDGRRRFTLGFSQ